MIHVEKALASAREAWEAGDLEAAERELLPVLEVDDLEPRALRLMGQIARARGDPERAADLFERALEARHPEAREGPQGPRPTPSLAELYAEQGYPEAAAEVYRRLLEGEEGDPRAEQWRRRLAELEGGPSRSARREEEPPEEAGAVSPVGEPIGEEPESGTGSTAPEPPEAFGGPNDEGDSQVVEDRLRDFLERLKRYRSADRLGRFLETLGNPSVRGQ